MEILAKDITWMILAYLSKKDLINLSLVNRYWQKTIQSDAFITDRFSQAGLAGADLIEKKPTQVSPLEWYYLIMEKDILNDPINQQLQLTPEQAYLRSKPYQRKLRHPLLILLETIKRRDYTSFCQQLELIDPADLLRFRDEYFEPLDYELVRSALFTDQPQFLRKVIDKFPDEIEWDFFDHGIQRSHLVLRQMHEILKPIDEDTTDYMGILEDRIEGQLMEDYLNDRPIQISEDVCLTTILMNLEQRDLTRARKFLQRYQDYPVEDEDESVFGPVKQTQFFRLFQMTEEMDFFSTLLLPAIDLPKGYHDDEMEVSILPLEGVYYYAKHLDDFPLDSAKVIDYLIGIDDAWDAIVSILLQQPIQLNLADEKYKHLSKKKKSLLEKAIQGKVEYFWETISADDF